MKRKLFLILLLITGALVLLSSQAIAAPQSLETKKTPAASENVPGDKAIQKAEKKAQQAEAKALRAEQKSLRATDTAKVKKENFQGIISAVDASSITLLLRDASVLTFAITEETRLSMPTLREAAIEDFELGRRVKVKAIRAEDETLTALAVTLIPGKPVRRYHVGVVTDYIPGESITIQTAEDKMFTYRLTEDTRILPAEREELLQVGAKVTVISPRNLIRIEQTALKIIVHPEIDEEP